MSKTAVKERQRPVGSRPRAVRNRKAIRRRRQLRLVRTIVVALALVLVALRPHFVYTTARSIGTWYLRVAPVPVDLTKAKESNRGDASRRTATSSSNRSPSAAGTQAFATVFGLTLHIPSAHLTTVAYHEASLPAALELHPLGRCIRNANPWKFKRPRPTPGPRYIVMSSRGRIHPATSAVDVAMTNGSDVLSPVSGKVFKIKKYGLYGKYVDYRISMIPEKTPRLAVVMIHLAHLGVRPGERLIAGHTRIGSPRRFPFQSQVNDYVGWGVPHVHVEVKRIGRQGPKAAR